MYSYQYGGKQGQQFNVDIADDLVVVRTKNKKSLQDAVQSPSSQQLLSQLSPIATYQEADVTVLQCKGSQRNMVSIRDRARRALKQESEIQFAGKVLREPNQPTPVVYTENLFVKFTDDQSQADCKAALEDHGLTIKEALTYAKNSYFVSAADGTGLSVFQLASDLLQQRQVELCHPELIKPSAMRALSPNQWHLSATNIGGRAIDAHVNVAPAWLHTRGVGTTIAVIDDGVDIEHEEFSSPDKIVAPFDATQNIEDPRPKVDGDNHGTACAGVACADGNHGASGVAPDAKLMPIRLRSGLGSQAEANAFIWAADKGADVISCSWGPRDGQWWSPTDATHNTVVAIPDSTRLAIDYAINNGRGGKGCVITWAAGNGNENVENDGYASYDKVIAVAACNDSNKRSVYSDFGESIWCTFPSSDFGHADFNHPRPLTSGIWTTDREGAVGYNSGSLDPNGNPPGDDHGHYTETFGGTSSACPGVAGIAALMISANPQLGWEEIKTLIKQSCVSIDTESGSYDELGHSPFYGFGRPDAEKAVTLAKGNQQLEQVETLTMLASGAGNLLGDKAEKLFMVYLTGNATVKLDGPDGNDFDLYVKRGVKPTTEEYDDVSYSSGADEMLVIRPESPGKYYLMVNSYKGKGEFTLSIENTQ